MENSDHSWKPAGSGVWGRVIPGEDMYFDPRPLPRRDMPAWEAASGGEGHQMEEPRGDSAIWGGSRDS